MNKNRRQIKRFESPFLDQSPYDPTRGRGYPLEPHGRFHGQRIGGQRLSVFYVPPVARDFWYRGRIVPAPIDHRRTKGLDRYGGKFFGTPGREAVQVNRTATTVIRQVRQPDTKPNILLRGGEIIISPGNGADYAMEYGRSNNFRTAGWNKPRSNFHRGEVQFIKLDNHPFSSRLGYFRFAGIPLEKKQSLQLRRAYGGRFGVISVGGEAEVPTALLKTRTPAIAGIPRQLGFGGKVLRFPIPPTQEIPESHTPKSRSVVANIIHPWGGDSGAMRRGVAYDQRVEQHRILFRQILPISRKPDYGTGSIHRQIKHPEGPPWTLPFLIRIPDVPSASRLLASGRGTKRYGTPHLLGIPWTLPFSLRFIKPPSAAQKLAPSRGSIRFGIPHPAGLPKTDPWRYRITRTNPAFAKILDRISGGRRWGVNSRGIIQSIDTSKLPIYIDVIWDPEEVIEIQYEPEIDIDLEVA